MVGCLYYGVEDLNFVRHLSLGTCLCLIELKKSTGFVVCFLVMVRMYTPPSKKYLPPPAVNVKDDLLQCSKQNTARVFMKQRAQDFTAEMVTVVVNLLDIHFHHFVPLFGLFNYALMHRELFRVFMQKLSWQARVVLIWPVHLLV